MYGQEIKGWIDTENVQRFFTEGYKYVENSENAKKIMKGIRHVSVNQQAHVFTTL